MKPKNLRTFLFLLIPLLFFTGVVAVRPAAAGEMTSGGGRLLRTAMTGAAEVPGPGDPDGLGVAVIALDEASGMVCWKLVVAGIDPATAAHIHRAPVGVAGPVVVPLSPPTNGSSTGCASPNPDLIKEIRQFPERFYVNVHNPAHPAGALRGQLK